MMLGLQALPGEILPMRKPIIINIHSVQKDPKQKFEYIQRKMTTCHRRKSSPRICPGFGQPGKASAAKKMSLLGHLYPVLVPPCDVEPVGSCTTPPSLPALGQESPNALPNSTGLNGHTILQNMPKQNYKKTELELRITHAWTTSEQECEVTHGRLGTTPGDPCGHLRLAVGPCGQEELGQPAIETEPGKKELQNKETRPVKDLT